MPLQQNNSISFVIPCFNEERRIQSLLSSIENFQQSRWHDYQFEFILVNDGSTDSTTDKISKHKLYRRNQIRYLSYKYNIGKGYALKLGVLSSKNNWIITLDADLSVSFVDAIDIFNQSYSNNDLVYLTESGIGHTLYYLYKNNKDIYIIEIEGLSYESDFKISGIDKVWY